MGQQKPYEIQQGQMPSSVPGKEEPFAAIETGADGMESSSAEGQVGSETAEHPGHRESHQLSGAWPTDVWK